MSYLLSEYCMMTFSCCLCVTIFIHSLLTVLFVLFSSFLSQMQHNTPPTDKELLNSELSLFLLSSDSDSDEDTIVVPSISWEELQAMQPASVLIEDELETAVESNTCSLVDEDIHEVETTVAMTQSLAKQKPSKPQRVMSRRTSTFRRHTETTLTREDPPQHSKRLSAFDATLLRAEKQQQHPRAYTDPTLMLPYCPEKNTQLSSLSAEMLYKRVKGISMFVQQAKDHALARKDAGTQRILIEQAATGSRVISSTTNQAPSNLLTTLGQFFFVVVLFEAPFCGKLPEKLLLTMEMLLCPIRIAAFGRFLTLSNRAPLTIRNRMLHIVGVLKQMKDTPELAEPYGHRIRAAKRAAGEVRRAAMARVPKIQATEESMAEMVRTGRMFASAQEHDTFNRWLFRVFAEGIAALEKQKGRLGLEQAALMQAVVATLMMDFSGGQRRQVIAELTVDGIDWCSYANWQQRQLKQLSVRPGVEKVNRLSRGKLPLPNFLRGHVAVLLELVRPALLQRRRRSVILSTQDPEPLVEVKALWIDAYGRAMQPSSFSQMLGRLSARFNPHLHILPKAYRYTYLTNVDSLLAEWNPVDGDAERCVTDFANATQQVRRDNYDRSCPMDRHVRVQETLLGPRLKRLSEDIQRSCTLVEPLLQRLVAEEQEANPPPEDNSDPGRMVRTILDDKKWQREMAAYKVRQQSVAKDGRVVVAGTRKQRSPVSTNKAVLRFPAKERKRVQPAKRSNQLTPQVLKKLTLIENVFFKDRFPKHLKPPEKLIEVTETMRQLGHKRFYTLGGQRLERIVNKGICWDTKKQMYQVAWQDRKKCTWEYEETLKEYDHLSEAIDIYEKIIQAEK